MSQVIFFIARHENATVSTCAHFHPVTDGKTVVQLTPWHSINGSSSDEAQEAYLRAMDVTGATMVYALSPYDPLDLPTLHELSACPVIEEGSLITIWESEEQRVAGTASILGFRLRHNAQYNLLFMESVQPNVIGAGDTFVIATLDQLHAALLERQPYVDWTPAVNAAREVAA